MLWHSISLRKCFFSETALLTKYHLKALISSSLSKPRKSISYLLPGWQITNFFWALSIKLSANAKILTAFLNLLFGPTKYLENSLHSSTLLRIFLWSLSAAVDSQTSFVNLIYYQTFCRFRAAFYRIFLVAFFCNADIFSWLSLISSVIFAGADDLSCIIQSNPLIHTESCLTSFKFVTSLVPTSANI